MVPRQPAGDSEVQVMVRVESREVNPAGQFSEVCILYFLKRL